VFDLSKVKALQEDMDKKATIAQRFWAMGVPFNQINEKLELGFDPMPWHEEGYLPFSVSSTNTPKIEPLEPEKPKEIAEEDGKSKSLKKSDNDKEWQAKAEESWQRITQSTNKIESNFEAKTSRLFLDIRKTILNILFTGEANKSKSLIVKELSKEELEKNVQKINAYNYKKEQEILRKFSQGYYEQSIKDGVHKFANDVGIDLVFDLTDPFVVDFLTEKLVKVVGITDTIKNQLSVAIAEGMDEGETVKEIADRIREQFNFADKRAKVIARTEVFGATNFGRNAAIQESGFKKKKWFTAKDDRVRPTHQEMHGKSIDIDEDWEVGNSQLRFPADPSGDPSEIISCRCVETVTKE
jgi:SPP1 gp7 family putative phage head morphogenesis protein